MLATSRGTKIRNPQQAASEIPKAAETKYVEIMRLNEKEILNIIAINSGRSIPWANNQPFTHKFCCQSINFQV